MSKQVVRAVAAASALLLAMSAQAALVTYRLSGWVTQSGTFDDGTTVPEFTPVTVSFSYETKQAATSLDRHEDGSGRAAYEFGAPYHFTLRVGDHRARTTGHRVTLNNDLYQPFGDTFDLEALGGATVDGVAQPQAQLTVSLLSQGGHTDALRSLSLPKHLNEWAFDAFRAGRLGVGSDRTLLMFEIQRIKSTVCAEALPSTDDCAQ